MGQPLKATIRVTMKRLQTARGNHKQAEEHGDEATKAHATEHGHK